MLSNRRALIKSAITVGASASFLRSLPLLAQSSDEVMLEMVHPELRTLASQLLKMNFPAITQKTLNKSREALLPMRSPRLADVSVSGQRIPGGKGQPDVEIFIINALAGEARPAILHCHGGGFVMGSAQDSIRDLQEMSKSLGCVVVSVEYRLAPETRYSGSLEDNYAALKWLHNNAESLGVDPERIAVMGESAGGGHAALLAIVARDRGEIPIAFQCLIYPMRDDRTGSSHAAPPHVGKLLWNAESNRFGWSSFLGVLAGSDKVPVHAVPARVEDLQGLPPAYIAVGSLDLLADENMEYARRLNSAAVSTQLLVVAGAFHGFDALQKFGVQTCVGKEFNQTKLDALRQGLNIKNPTCKSPIKRT